MTGDATADARLEARIHDAYEVMGPSEEAQDRVLSALREAAKSAGGDAPVAERPTRRGSLRWLVALPVAACLVLVAFLVGRPVTSEAPSSVAKQEALEAGESDSASDAAEAIPTAVEMSDEVASSDAAYADSTPTWEYPEVELSDGTRLHVVGECDAPSTTDEVQEAVAWSEDGAQSIACEVTKRTKDTYCVRYEGDGAWYEARPA